MKWSGNADQVLREIGEDAPVVSFIGVRQGRAGNPTTESHVVELAAHRFQARLNVAETLAVSELSEGHRQILIPARQTSVVLIAVIASHTLLELEVGEMSDQLRENGSAGIHPPLFRRCGVQPFSSLRLFSVQIVFEPNASYSMDGKGLAGLRKVLYRTPVTCSKGLPGVGFSRPEWETIKAISSGPVTRKAQDDTLPDGPRDRVIEYLAPFDSCDREAARSGE